MNFHHRDNSVSGIKVPISIKNPEKSGSFDEKLHKNKRIKGLGVFKKSGIPDKSGNNPCQHNIEAAEMS